MNFFRTTLLKTRNVKGTIYTKYSTKKEEHQNNHIINPTTKNVCYNKDKLSCHGITLNQVLKKGLKV